MQELIASVDHIKFDLEMAVEQQLGAQPLPFPGMDSAWGRGGNKECPFLHIDPESKIKDCPWYDRGFCKHGMVELSVYEILSLKVYIAGPLCRHRHTRRVICVNYLVGFCPEGPTCKFMHPRFELPMGTTEQPPLPQPTQTQQKRTPQVIGVMQSQNNNAGNRGPRPLEQVTCYKCGEKGHYANRCTKGHLAFLSGQ
uniref:Cleavage and polyadenylation specificity factor subunit 4 n=1 Tax=Crocodylus porosus TaxID=8502 RepID=A0A7M4FCY1_CROPO